MQFFFQSSFHWRDVHMRFSRALSIVVVLGVMLGISGCSVRIGDFTTLSTKNVTLSDKFVKVGRFADDDMAWSVLFIPFGFPDMKTAVDNLLDHNGGDLVTNAVLTAYSMPLIIVSQRGYKVEGDVWKKASMGDLMNGEELFDLATMPDGRQELVSARNVKTRYSVTTSEDLMEQYEGMK